MTSQDYIIQIIHFRVGEIDSRDKNDLPKIPQPAI